MSKVKIKNSHKLSFEISVVGNNDYFSASFIHRRPKGKRRILVIIFVDLLSKAIKGFLQSSLTDEIIILGYIFMAWVKSWVNHR